MGQGQVSKSDQEGRGTCRGWERTGFELTGSMICRDEPLPELEGFISRPQVVRLWAFQGWHL